MQSSLRFLWSALGLTLVFLLAPAASAGVLDDVATANAHLKRAESNLQLVDGSIGHLTKPPRGSAARLAKMRLDQAVPDIDAAGKLLKGGKGKGLAEAVARHKAAVELHAKLAAILTGKPVEPAKDPENKDPEKKDPENKDPEKKEPERPADAPKTVKLGYPHADNFKGTLFNLRRVEGEVAGLTKLSAELRPVADQLELDHRKTAGAMAKITEMRRQAGFVRDGLGKIPANGEGVAEAKERLVQANKSLDAAQAYFEPLNARLMKLVDPASYPAFDADVKRLRELSSAYANPDYLFREQRTQAAEAYAQADAAKAECVRIATVYARLMEQKTDLGARVEAAGNGFLRSHAEFLTKAEQQRTGLPAEIRRDLAEVDRMAEDAVANQKPLWFTGGIPQNMGWVVDKLALLEALDPRNAAPVKQEVERMQASLRERADSLKELIIRENRLPLDRFAGADREHAIAVARSAWKIQESDFELLAVRIPSEAWSRETKWTYSNGTWYFVDRSTLQVRLIVADEQNRAWAIDRPINVRKDHQKGDTLIGVPMRSVDEALQPSEYFLRSKIK